MKGQISLGRVFGIVVGLHYSWFFIAALLTFSLRSHLHSVNPEWSATLAWSAAIVTAIAFFAALLAHELSHAAVARARGVPVRAITLFALGGVAHMGRDAADARTEFWMGLAGPAISVIIGGAALLTAVMMGWTYTMTPETAGMTMLVWFGWINFVLAAFNMIPGFPLDGGRVLRAAIWWITGDLERATRIAAGLGQFFALLFILFGVFSFLRGTGAGSLWLAFIGMFLLQSARAAVAQMALEASLHGVTVGDVMARDCIYVERATPIADVADEVLRTGRRCFLVMDEGRVVGLLTPKDIRTIDREQWRAAPAGQAMRPYDRLHEIRAEAPVREALEIIAREDVNQLPVVDGGRVRGVISRDQILRVIATRQELTAM